MDSPFGKDHWIMKFIGFEVYEGVPWNSQDPTYTLLEAGCKHPVLRFKRCLHITKQNGYHPDGHHLRLKAWWWNGRGSASRQLAIKFSKSWDLITTRQVRSHPKQQLWHLDSQQLLTYCTTCNRQQWGCQDFSTVVIQNVLCFIKSQATLQACRTYTHSPIQKPSYPLAGAFGKMMSVCWGMLSRSPWCTLPTAPQPFVFISASRRRPFWEPLTCNKFATSFKQSLFFHHEPNLKATFPHKSSQMRSCNGSAKYHSCFLFNCVFDEWQKTLQNATWNFVFAMSSNSRFVSFRGWTTNTQHSSTTDPTTCHNT